jgi:hypothetical protein
MKLLHKEPATSQRASHTSRLRAAFSLEHHVTDTNQPHLQSSQAGIDEIVTEENSGPAHYTRHYTHFEWPAGASGPKSGSGMTADIPRRIKSVATGPGLFRTTRLPR